MNQSQLEGLPSTRVSIHICTRDRQEELYGLLVSLYCQTYENWDLILVDESAKPLAYDKCLRDVISRMRYDGHGVKIIRHEGSERQGISHARNAAIKADNWNGVFIRVDDDSICDKRYVEILVRSYEMLIQKGEKVGAVGGIVPLFGDAVLERDPKHVLPIFNKIEYENEKFTISDDGGVTYDSNAIIESHHLRSSFLFTKEAAYAAGLHSDMFGSQHSGFREETDFVMKMRLVGYKAFTIPIAKAWHCQSLSGGTRNANDPQVYSHSVQMNEEFFQRKWNRLLRQGKLPRNFVNKWICNELPKFSDVNEGLTLNGEKANRRSG